jgi:addiction module RelE/StbE family toxin
MRIRWTQPALEDFKTISHRIEQDRNLETANRVCRSIYGAIQLLRQHPYTGRVGAKEGTRELVIPKSPYLTVYRHTGEAIEILRLYHGAQKR